MTRFSNSTPRKSHKRLSRRRPNHRKCFFEMLEDRRLLTTGLVFDSVSLAAEATAGQSVFSSSAAVGAAGNRYLVGDLVGEAIDFDLNNSHPGNTGIVTPREYSDEIAGFRMGPWQLGEWRVQESTSQFTSIHHNSQGSFEFVWEPLAGPQDNHGDEGVDQGRDSPWKDDMTFEPALQQPGAFELLAGAGQEIGGAVAAASLAPLTSIPVLNSFLGAAATLFLDFDGHYEASWGNWTDAITPVYDTDGDRTTFSDEELDNIALIWERVAEDFAPLNVNVTTVEPAVLASGVPAGNANGEALRVAIGGSWQDWYGSSASGVGYVNSFTSSIPNVVYVFADGGSPAYGDVVSHEAGHGFGLQHQSSYDAAGNKTAEYNSGDGEWLPLMGAWSTSRISTWHNGQSTLGANIYQDDLAVLTNSTNGFGYRSDDHAGSSGSATPLNFDGSYWTGAGIIESNNDVDVFSFSTSGGALRFDVDVASYAPNLDAFVELRDSSNQLVASAAPTDSLNASVIASLAAGTYTLHVTKPTTYGWLGNYSISGFAVADGPVVSSVTPDGFSEGPIDSIRVSFAEPIDPTTFGPEDVLIKGPVGEVSVTGILAVAGSNNTQFDIQFAAQQTSGNYDLVLGANIADSSGNLMNQDQDEYPGEAGEDDYSARFSITALGSAFLLASTDLIYTNDIEVDSDGFIYMTGTFSGATDFDPGPVEAILTAQGTRSGFIAKYSPAQELVWATPMDITSGYVYGGGIHVDPSGDAIVAGHFSTTDTSAVATFGAFTRTSHGSADSFVGKINVNGNFVWVQSWGGTGSDTLSAMTVSADGTIHVGGNFSDTVDFNPSASTYALTSAGGADGYVSSFDSSGSFLNATSFGGSSSDSLRRLAGDANGNIYAVGNFQQTAQFGPSYSLTSAGSSDNYLVKMSPVLNVEWIQQASSTSSMSIPDVAVDNTGSAYLTSYFTDSVDFGSGTTMLSNSGNRDSFIAKWSSAGDFQWARQFEGSGATNRITEISIDVDNNAYFAGYFGGTVDFDLGAGVVERTTLNAQGDFLLKLNSAGEFQFVHQVERDDTGMPRSMASTNAATFISPGISKGRRPCPTATFLQMLKAVATLTCSK